MNKILVVDDDSHFRRLVKAILRNEDCNLYEASDGVEALSILETVQVDLVILEFLM